uniref:Wzz/FepE/Etk N-terminal domain-containing protein n=1 Tax=Paractinoplanes polyasparticus TaxID=2856853 RepID=UPI001C84CA07|nr:Wzz/FepE/Etk N-terminal domain-containing protein [Actinoplanes polyasparticus]
MINQQVKDKPSTVARGRSVSNPDTAPVSAPLLDEIVRHWKFIAVIVTACVAATAGYVYIVPQRWEASARVLVAPAGADADLAGLGLISGSADPARSLQTAVALLDTPAANAAAAARLGSPWSSVSVDRSIVLEPLGESYVVNVKAQADSPSAAARLATTYVESALATRNSTIKQRATALLALRTSLPASTRSELNPITGTRLQMIARGGDPSLSMAQPAVPPTSPVGLPTQYKIALSVVLGLCLAIAAVWARARGSRPDDGMRVPAQAPDDNGWNR